MLQSPGSETVPGRGMVQIKEKLGGPKTTQRKSLEDGLDRGAAEELVVVCSVGG
jgi:hypothetical protein